MNGSTYLKLASAAREFAQQDDVWQAMVDADAETRAKMDNAVAAMPEVLAAAAILILGVARCGIMAVTMPPGDTDG